VKKISTLARSGNEIILKEAKLTIGLDLGDRGSHYCILDEAGKVILEHDLLTTPKEFTRSSARSSAVASHWKLERIHPG
jgi:hypothetical protein